MLTSHNIYSWVQYMTCHTHRARPFGRTIACNMFLFLFCNSRDGIFFTIAPSRLKPTPSPRPPLMRSTIENHVKNRLYCSCTRLKRARAQRSDALLLAMIGECSNPVYIFHVQTTVKLNALLIKQFTCVIQ